MSVFMDDLKAGLASALDGIRNQGGLTGFIDNAFANATVHPVNTGDTAFHAAESYNAIIDSLDATNQETVSAANTKEHMQAAGQGLDTAYVGIKNGSLSEIGGGLKTAFTEGAGGVADFFRTMGHSQDANMAAHLAGEHAELAGNNGVATVTQALNGMQINSYNNGVMNVTSPVLTQQMGSSMGEWIEDNLNRLNHDVVSIETPFMAKI